MKKLPTLFFAILMLAVASKKISAQINLVPNPSFEDTTACPQFIGQIDFATGWTSYRESPDYFNACANAGGMSVPSNVRGYQIAASGNAYAGIACYRCCINIREYLGAQLLTPLIKGQKYFVSLKVSLCDYTGFDCAINNLGVRFFMQSYTPITPAPLNNFAHIRDTNIISNKSTWTAIKGSFIADTNYQYLSIGNFYTDSHTDTLSCIQFAAYYIDDVCVSTDSLMCMGNVGVQEVFFHQMVNIYPNPSENKLAIKKNCSEKVEYSIFSNLGYVLKNGVLFETETNLDIGSLKKGIYILIVHSNSKNQTVKFIKN